MFHRKIAQRKTVWPKKTSLYDLSRASKYREHSAGDECSYITHSRPENACLKAHWTGRTSSFMSRSREKALRTRRSLWECSRIKLATQDQTTKGCV